MVFYRMLNRGIGKGGERQGARKRNDKMLDKGMEGEEKGGIHTGEREKKIHKEREIGANGNRNGNA